MDPLNADAVLSSVLTWLLGTSTAGIVAVALARVVLSTWLKNEEMHKTVVLEALTRINSEVSNVRDQVLDLQRKEEHARERAEEKDENTAERLGAIRAMAERDHERIGKLEDNVIALRAELGRERTA